MSLRGVEVIGAEIASMGPRRGGRGMTFIGKMAFNCFELQWGRGAEAAECVTIATPSGSINKLQWGRGAEAAEWRPTQ